MDRRRFLALSGLTVLGGCSARSDDGTPTETPVETATPTETAPQGDSRGLDSKAEELWESDSVVDFETAPLRVSSYGSRLQTPDRIYAMPALTEPATDESPARLEVVFRNEMEYEQTFRLRRFPILWDPVSGRTDDREEMFLAPTSNHAFVENPPDTERDGDGRWRLADSRADWFDGPVTLGGGKAAYGEYRLLAPPDEDEPPISANRYEFNARDMSFTIAAWNRNAPGPDGDSRFAGESVPSLPRDGRMTWYHEADTETRVYLQPSAEAVSTPAKIDFEQVNHSPTELSGNPYDWALYKLEDGEWFRIAPWMTPDPLARVPPGGVDESTLWLFDDDGPDGGSIRGDRTAPHLGGGRYAYWVSYSREDGGEHAALLDVEAPELQVDAEADVETERDGGTVIVHSPRRADARRPATLTVERAAGDDASRRIIDEQLPRRPNRGFKNTLPLFDADVDAVELRTDRSTALRPVGFDDGGREFVRYDGDVFEVVGEVVDEE